MYLERLIDKTCLKGLRILIIESKRDERDLLAYILESHSATVISEALVSNAIARFVYHPPDVVFASVKAMSEYALAKQFRFGATKAGKETLIIAVAESSRSIYPTIAEDLDCDAYISKPLDMNEVVTLVTTIVAKQQRYNYVYI